MESLATEDFLWVGILTLRETQEHVFGLESVTGALSEVCVSWVSLLNKLFLYGCGLTGLSVVIKACQLSTIIY